MNPSSTPQGSQSPFFGFWLRNWPWFLGALVFLALLVAVPQWQTAGVNLPAAEKIALQTQIRDTLAKLLWSGITLFGVFTVWRHMSQLTAVVEFSAQTLAHAQKTAYFASQSAATDRYSRAMGLLGDPKMEVCLGGIYSLERLARESDKDHSPIMEVLAAYVRERSGWEEGEPVPPRAAPDIQAIATVLGRRHTAYDAPHQRLDLHGVNLARVYLPWAELKGAFLYETNLEGAMLQNANLRDSWLWKAHLKDASLDGAHLEGADLTGVAGLTRDQLLSAHLDKRTKLPEHLRDIRGNLDTPDPTEADMDSMSLPTLVTADAK